MKRRMSPIKTALVPIGLGTDGEQALALAQSIASEVILIGIVPVAYDESISAGAQTARKIRKRLLSLSRNSDIRYKSTVIVSKEPWEDLKNVIHDEDPNILVLEWIEGKVAWGDPIAIVLVNPVCDVALIHGKIPHKIKHTLMVVRGGPYAELTMQVGINMKAEEKDVLHLSILGDGNDAPFIRLQKIIKHLPEVKLRSRKTDDVLRTIAEEATKSDVVVLGATASRATGTSIIGPVAENLLHKSNTTTIVVKSRRTMTESMLDESAGAEAISVLVDKWFAENTFHANEFSDLKELMSLKEAQGSTISLALPALNEEETVGKVITTIQKNLMKEVPLIDEIVLMDSNSTDRTRQIAKELGVEVHIHQHTLPEMGSRPGKGEALWKSLLVTKGDIIAWIDTDIVNIHPRFVYGIIGPLLLNSNIQLVKGFYRRPLKVGDKVQAGGGGRVTELTARPLLNLFYPELSGVVQPLSGEYAGRREALERSTFFSGYGVETGLVIDIFEQFGLSAIAQVDLLQRIHHNQELEALGKMSFAIIQAVLRKLEPRFERSFIEEINRTMKLIKYNKGGYHLELEEVAERERPPMITIPAYKERHKND
ncbi:MAG TPA: glucosyl-3-phosphoglycerate synthase [Anaerolineales bacterium]|nr:glucosyl-3-phosphoglycerate synthase [Anaerolineales bacterium]